MAGQDIFDGQLKDDQRNEFKEPDMFRVLLHNDHYTTMEFVVQVLQQVFHKTAVEASQIMMDVHQKGIGIVGVYTHDIARTKVGQVKKMAKEAEFPLRCSYEKV